MGRTFRKRRNKKNLQEIKNLDVENSTIQLKKWMKSKNWENINNLKLKNFPFTGRGVTSSTFFKENDVLIQIPYDLMITYTTVCNSELFTMIFTESRDILKIQDLLSLFLLREKQLEEKSSWKPYIDSLPEVIPYLPWLCSENEFSNIPADLKLLAEKRLKEFHESFNRVQKSIKKNFDCVLEINLYKWSYVLVNTRAVYVDPEVVKRKTINFYTFLSDLPKMALCPYLDMFNHSTDAKTEAEFRQNSDKLFYQLKTLTSYPRYDQIFISYGAHDNIKLLMEYGFFIPTNKNDTIVFQFQEIVILLKISFNERQYKFIKNHELDNIKSLYVSYSGPSFNLKALLFVGFYPEVKNYSAITFSDNYPEEFCLKTQELLNILLNHKLNIFEDDVQNIGNISEKTSNFRLLENYLKYRIDFVNDLINSFR